MYVSGVCTYYPMRLCAYVYVCVCVCMFVHTCLWTLVCLFTYIYTINSYQLFSSVVFHLLVEAGNPADPSWEIQLQRPKYGSKTCSTGPREK